MYALGQTEVVPPPDSGGSGTSTPPPGTSCVVNWPQQYLSYYTTLPHLYMQAIQAAVAACKAGNMTQATLDSLVLSIAAQVIPGYTPPPSGGGTGTTPPPSGGGGTGTPPPTTTTQAGLSTKAVLVLAGVAGLVLAFARHR